MAIIGTLIEGKYEILKLIGKGGMSEVYLAMDKNLNKQWAVKEIKKRARDKNNEVVVQSAIAEANMMKKLDHPCLPRIVDIIDKEDVIYVVMDYIEGEPLNKVLERDGAQPQETVIEWAEELCGVLDYLHMQNPPIIYRDMKPANIMLQPNGNIKLIDFGIAREYKEHNLEDTVSLGTKGYAAPEQFGGKGQTDQRTDIYCLGVTLYHLVTGKNPCEPPYEIRPIREINPSLSGGLEQIILKCTQRNPQDRYQSCAELMYALEHYDEIDDVFRKKQKRKLTAFASSVSLMVICAAVSIWGYISAENKKSENYDIILKRAENAEDYYEAILTDPVRTDAYLGLNDLLINDFVLTREEGQTLQQLRLGLDQKNAKGFYDSVDVLGKLKNSNPKGYEEVCYQFGESFMFYYDVNTDYDRYVNAEKWFAEVSKEDYPIAGIYCDIADCMELINQYNGAKVKQTEKMYEEYGRLWEMVGELKDKADEFGSVDAKLQVWNEINRMINERAVQFLEVATAEELQQVLNSISEEAGAVQESVISEDIQKLQDAIRETQKKLDSVGE